MPTSIIVHERIAEWVGWLRPRFAASPGVQWVESRSSADLTAAVEERDRSIVLINLANRTYWGMEGLDALHQAHRDPLTLVLDPQSVPEVPWLARELGATLVWSGVVVPPQVEILVRRWVGLLESRSVVGRRIIRTPHTLR